MAKTSQLRLGMDTKHDYSCDVGSMATEQQRAIVSRHVDHAGCAKARTVSPAGRHEITTFSIAAQVLADVDHGMDCMREETFGPTLPVMKVRDAAEAIEKANDFRGFELAGSIWTRDKAKAMALARQMNTGTVTLNNVLVGITQFGVPFGGWNDSGVGARSGGADGIRKYCRAKSIVAERITMKKEPNWYPYSSRKGKLVTAAGRFVGARDWRGRLGLGARPIR